MTVPVHTIQKQILLKLAGSDEKLFRFSELKPGEVENDLFNYHLQYLIKQGFVAKEEAGYKITGAGVEHILLIDSKGISYEGFRASVLVYVIDRETNPVQILLQKRKRKPYLGETDPGIAGKIKQGEGITEAAQRKLLEETGLKGNCKEIGVIRKIRKVENSDLIDDGFFFVCVCEDFSGELSEVNDYGENYWADSENALVVQAKKKSAGAFSMRVLKRVIDGDYSNFLYEEKLTVKNL
jgi:ADP-ribose pyrophosphatase YjhB (NUDIX family)